MYVSHKVSITEAPGIFCTEPLPSVLCNSQVHTYHFYHINTYILTSFKLSITVIGTYIFITGFLVHNCVRLYLLPDSSYIQYTTVHIPRPLYCSTNYEYLIRVLPPAPSSSKTKTVGSRVGGFGFGLDCISFRSSHFSFLSPPLQLQLH